MDTSYLKLQELTYEKFENLDIDTKIKKVVLSKDISKHPKVLSFSQNSKKYSNISDLEKEEKIPDLKMSVSYFERSSNFEDYMNVSFSFPLAIYGKENIKATKAKYQSQQVKNQLEDLKVKFISSIDTLQKNIDDSITTYNIIEKRILPKYSQTSKNFRKRQQLSKIKYRYLIIDKNENEIIKYKLKAVDEKEKYLLLWQITLFYKEYQVKFILSALILGVTILNAQILEVEQLFNKKLVKVKKEQIGTLKSFYGRLTFDETKIYDIVSRFDGFVTNLDAKEQYQTLKKGEKLFSLYSDEVLSIQQEIQIAKNLNKQLVKSSLDKLKALDINTKVINRIKNSKTILKDIPFYSPSNSIVLKKEINQGSFVKKGKLLLQLASLDSVWFIASIYQKDLSFIK